jgi:hypothetical protein
VAIRFFMALMRSRGSSRRTLGDGGPASDAVPAAADTSALSTAAGAPVASSSVDAGVSLGTGSRACSIGTATASSGVTTTRVPSLVIPHSSAANLCGSRMHPWEAGYPGTTPPCSATPDQVRRCM